MAKCAGIDCNTLLASGKFCGRCDPDRQWQDKLVRTTTPPDAKDALLRLEKLPRKIVAHAEKGMGGSEAYAHDRLRQISQLAAYGVERITGQDAPIVDDFHAAASGAVNLKGE